jgi:Domain of unknown function (DUF4252)
MRGKIIALIWTMGLALGTVSAQTKTTQALSTQYDDALELYFYKNTLRMLNQEEDPGFDDLIKDIEKLKFLLIDKSEGFEGKDYKKLLTDYKKESYEEIMTGRFEGRNFDVYLKESGGKTQGMVILASDSSNLYVLDLLGRVEISKVTQLFKTLDESSDITKKIKAFTDKGEDKGRRRHDDDEDN